MHLTARKTRWSETCPRSGRLGFSRYPASLASSECGPDQASNGLRPESKARDIASPLLRGGRRSPACRRSGAKRQPNLEIRFPLTLLCRLMLGPLRAPSRTSRAPTACGQNQKRSRTSSLLQKLCRSRDPLLSTHGLSGSRFCRRRRSPACRRSGAKRQPNLKIRFRLTLLGRMISSHRGQVALLRPTARIKSAREQVRSYRSCVVLAIRCCQRAGAVRESLLPTA